MSALPPKADICSAPGHVRFGPEADIWLEDGEDRPHHMLSIIEASDPSQQSAVGSLP